MKKLLLCLALLVTTCYSQNTNDRLMSLTDVETKIITVYTDMATELAALHDPEISRIMNKYLTEIVKLGEDYEKSKGRNEAKNKGR